MGLDLLIWIGFVVLLIKYLSTMSDSTLLSDAYIFLDSLIGCDIYVIFICSSYFMSCAITRYFVFRRTISTNILPFFTLGLIVE